MYVLLSFYIVASVQSVFTSVLVYIWFNSYIFLICHMFYHPGADPYCKVKMGRYKGRTHVCKDTLNPVWNSTIILYGRNPAGKTVTVKVRS